MNQAIATRALRLRPDILGGIATLGLAMAAACGGTVGFEPHPPGAAGDASVAPSADASPAGPGVDASVPDAGTDDDSVIERPPARDTGVSSGPAMDDGASEGGPGISNGRPVTTASIFAALGPDCLWCTVVGGCFDPALLGGTCEDAQRFGSGCGVGSKDADGGAGGGDASSASGGACPCFAPTNPTGSITCYNDICTKTLEDIFSSHCAESLQETPCLCGSNDPAVTGPCLGGSVAPTGPILPDYEIDFPVTPGLKTEGQALQPLFTNQAYGAGQANELVQCAAAFACDECFGGGPDGGGAGPVPGDAGAATQAVLSAQSSDCLSCAQSSGCLDPQVGGSCEDTQGTATLSGQPLSDGGTCAGLFGSSSPPETQVCLGTLQAIFASGCQPTAQDPVTLCLSGGAIPASLADDYTCEFNTASGLQQAPPAGAPWTFVDRSLGAGRANALAQCLGANRCDSCFHAAPEAGAPEAGGAR